MITIRMPKAQIIIDELVPPGPTLEIDLKEWRNQYHQTLWLMTQWDVGEWWRAES